MGQTREPETDPPDTQSAEVAGRAESIHRVDGEGCLEQMLTEHWEETGCRPHAVHEKKLTRHCSLTVHDLTVKT